ncbi:MAG: hypothetical protein L3J34_02785 [Flavobacteriaceae bacterium]|nr:hypothetical protein [Flavobacteriaceae bacterium]
MKNKKIIFIFNLLYKNIQFYELIGKLNRLGNKVMVYDLISSKKYDPSTDKTEYFNPFFGANYILRIRYFRAFFKPIINRMVINREFNKCDTVNLHYVAPQYAKYANLIKKRVGLFIISFWGSDVLRADDKKLTKYIPLFDSCDAICVPDKMQEEFIEIYTRYNKKHGTLYNYVDKLKTLYFGISIFDYINKVNNKLIIKFKEKYSLPKANNIFITIAHNGSHGQQHIIIINKLTKINNKLKNKIFLLLPFTYGGSNEYKKEVLNHLGRSGIKYQILTEYMDMQELAVLRVISNININIQITDGFSASISEAIYAKNIVITGDWLPYEIYEDWGILMYFENIDKIGNRIIDVINHYDEYREKIKGNDTIIYNKLSWNAVLPIWEKMSKV